MPSNRRRLGVAVLLDPPVATEVDGLRRALGDPGLGRIPPHVTLVPPVNVRRDDLPRALERLRRAAAAQPGPIGLTIGAVQSFLPDNPVLYLAVGGDLERLRDLRDAVFSPPLERPLSWPWVPHVTVADGVAEDRIAAGLTALAGYAAVVEVDRVVLLEEVTGRVWTALADAGLGAAARVGTGGLPLELTTGRLADPQLWPADLRPPEGIAITAHREGRPVGGASLWRDSAGGHVAVWVAEDARCQGVGGHLLAHAESAARRGGWRDPLLAAHGPAGFYLARSAWAVPVGQSKATEE